MKSIKKFWKPLLALGVAIVVGITVGCSREANPQGEQDKKLQVVATMYPVYDVAKVVGGDKIDLSMLVPTGAEPHDWEPTASDMKAIGKADIFLYNGLGIEPIDKILKEDILRRAVPIELAKAPGVTLITFGQTENVQVGEEDAHEHDHGSDVTDPHIWLNPINVQKEALYVAEVFSKKDPTNSAYYQENAKKYVAQLQALDEAYAAWKKASGATTLVVTHEAFGYMAHRYGLTQIGIMGISPDAEPTPDKMTSLVSFIKANKVVAIFNEVLVSTKLADTIAAETGAQTYVLNPVEGLTEAEQNEGDNYLSLMKSNLKTLEKAYPPIK